MRVAISTKHRFLYNRLPKNANSTINLSLIKSSSDVMTDLPSRPKHYFTRLSRLAQSQTKELGNYFKFVFVRNPYTRTLSAYLDKIVNRRPQSRAFFVWLKRHGHERATFEHFCRYLEATGLFDDNHWAPQTSGLVFPLDEYDFVGRFEHLSRDLNHVHQRIFAKGCTNPDRAGPKATGSDANLAKHYNQYARAVISRLYTEDFDLLGYPLVT